MPADDPLTPPRGLQRLRITCQAVYFYHRRFTLSFCWRCCWLWRPEIIWDYYPAQSIHWGWFVLEKLNFRPYDDWGLEAAETRIAIIRQLAESVRSAENGH